jgi:DNA modification methylase
MTAIVARADARDLPLPDGSVDLICTSPPYYGKRDYRDGGRSLAGQVGSEESPQEYVAALLDCTREWMRVLKPQGSMFVNLGDSYYSAKGTPGPNGADTWQKARRGWERPTDRSGLGFPRKTLLGLPARYMIGCIDGLGLIVRNDNIWDKVNPTPESAKDRCAGRHEYIFHLVKHPVYYSAVDEIRTERSSYARINGASRKTAPGQKPRTLADTVNPAGALPQSVWEIASQPLNVPERIAHARCCGGVAKPGCEGLGHSASFPFELPRRCILGWSPPGICAACGEGRFPVTDARRTLNGNPVGGSWQTEASGHMIGPQGVGHWRYATSRTHLGYACACTPFTDFPERRGRDFPAGTDRARQGMNDGNGGDRYRRYIEELENPRGPVREYHFDAWTPAPARPAVVVDPFGGTGTTALVADVLGRTGYSFDLSADYCELARWRTTDPGERARAAQVPKPPPVDPGQPTLFDEEPAGDAA